MTVYSEPHVVQYYEVDPKNMMKMSTVINLINAVSGNQLEKIGAGTSTMTAKGLGWVVTQYHFGINRLPKIMEKITIETEATAYNRFFCYRQYWLRDEQGQVLVSANSIWIMMDLQKRKLVPVDDEIMAKAQITKTTSVQKFAKIKLPQFDMDGKPYRVRYFDIDSNHHVNNAHYFDWLLDELPFTFLQAHDVATIEIKFDKEVRYGDQPHSLVKVDETPKRLTTYHQIQNAGEVAAEAIIIWQ